MKIQTKDNNGFPLNYDPSTYYKTKEIFLPLPRVFYNSDPNIYQVTTWGRIYNNLTGQFIPRELTRDRNIYILVAIRNLDNEEIHFPMHQLIARMFVIGKPVTENNYQMIPNHIDGVKWHNEPYNLEWVTWSENVRHADANNLISRPYGEHNGYSKLSDEQYHEICRLTQEGYWPNQINKMMDVGFDITNIVQKIRRGVAETVISSQYDFSNIPRSNYKRLSNEQVKIACSYLEKNKNNNEIDYDPIIEAMGFNLDEMSTKERHKIRDNIYSIKKGLSFKNISKNYDI